MVDAIGKLDSQKINWYQITLKEIQQYQSDGQDNDIPTEVKRWAEEMAKVANAPDNVTYEMSKSGAITAQNPEETGNTQIDQGIILGQQSDLAADEVENLMAEIDDWTANAANANTQAQDEYASAMAKINALQAQQSNAAASGDKAKAAAIANQLAAAGETAQGILGELSAQISGIEGNISGLTAKAQNAINIGTQAIEIGNAEIGNGNNSSAIETFVAQGTNAISVGNSGISAGTGANVQVSSFGQNIRAYANDIQQSSGAGAEVENEEEEKNKTTVTEENNPTDTENKTEDDNKTISSEKPENNEQEKEDPTLADKDITTDPLEILKRKEKRGEV